MNLNFFSYSKWTKLPKSVESSPEPYNTVTLNSFDGTEPYSHTSKPPFAPLESGGFKESVLVKPEWEEKENKPLHKKAWYSIIALSGSILVLVLILLLTESANGTTQGGNQKSVPSSIDADIGVVAADEERCSHVGIDTLKLGGNAIDAAISTCLCLGVLNPMASGIGGGAFMLIRLANGTTEVIDSREEAPSAANQDMYNETDASSVKGGLSVAVPGELAGLYLAWERYGKLPWNDLFRPAINFAENGFKVSDYLATAINESLTDILSSPELSSVFAPSGVPLKKDEICKMTKLASTLHQVAQQGPSVLYDGILSSSLAAEIQSDGGILTVEDLKSYSPKIREGVVGEAFGLTFIGAPPPSSGGPTVIQMLKILSGFPLPLASAGFLGLHRVVEAMKHAFALRMALGDPDYVDNSLVLADMLSDEFANELRRNISDNTTFPPSHYGGRWNQLNDHGTAHFSVVDGDRNAVSMTSTINLGFGSKLMSPSTGILLNNEMDDFSKPGEPNIFGLPPAEANFIRPKKRPLSSMAPMIVLQEGQLRAVAGGSGGPFIISASSQVLINYFALGMTSLQAVQAPRLHHQLLPDKLFYEDCHVLLDGENVSLSLPAANFLKTRGHDLYPIKYGGVSQFISHNLDIPATERDEFTTRNPVPGVFYGRLTAVSDARKDGKPAGW